MWGACGGGECGGGECGGWLIFQFRNFELKRNCILN